MEPSGTTFRRVSTLLGNLLARSLWKTSTHTCIAAMSDLFDGAVACLTFPSDENDYLVAVDWRGKTQAFRLAADGVSTCETRELYVPDREEVTRKLCREHRNAAGYNARGSQLVDSRSTIQISTDGQTVAYCVVAWLFQRQGILVIVWNLVHRFDGSNWTTK